MKLWRWGWRGRDFEREMNEELRFHVERQTAENIAAGMAAEDARRQAALQFGGVEGVKETCRSERRGHWFGTVLQDVRYGVRVLRKSPGFTAVAVLTLALGIGANTAIFSLVNAVMFRTLPVRDPHQLVLFMWRARAWPSMHGRGGLRGCPIVIRGDSSPGTCTFSCPLFEQVRSEQSSFSDTFAFAETFPMVLSFSGNTGQVQGHFVSGDFFSTLGVLPAIGRTIQPYDDTSAAKPAIVLSYELWRRQFGGDPSIVGKTVYLNRHAFTVAGVAAAHFFGLDGAIPSDFWVPMASEPTIGAREASLKDSHIEYFFIGARLKPGVSIAKAEAITGAMFVRDVTTGPDPIFKRGDGPRLTLGSMAHGLDSLRQDYSRSLLLLTFLAGIILLLACANIAGLALAHCTVRQKEMAVRLALGASRWRLIRQLLTESLLLSGAGGALGILLASWAASFVTAFLSVNSKSLFNVSGAGLQVNVRPDLRVLAFTFAISVLVGILAGLAPAFRGTRVDLTPALKESPSAAWGAQGWRWPSSGNILVIGQVALSILVLAGAGLLVRSIVNRKTAPLGFDTRNLLTFSLDATSTTLQGAQISALYQDLQAQFASLPSVVSASYSSAPPMSGFTPGGSSYTIDGAPIARGLVPMTDILYVSLEFFATLRIPMLAGRAFTKADLASSATAQPVIANQAFVKQALGNRNPLGCRVGTTIADSDAQIAGVAANARYDWVPNGTPPRPVLYALLRDQPAYFEIRASRNPMPLIPLVHKIVSHANSELVFADAITVAGQMDKLLYRDRLITWLSSLFAVLALLLSCIGLYGLLAYEVTRRTREIGIRMALGAQPRQVMRLVIGQGARLAVAGATVGIAAAAGLTRYLASQLYGVKPTDPVTFAGVAILLLIVALGACYIPARRAMRVDPMAALRQE